MIDRLLMAALAAVLAGWIAYERFGDLTDPERKV